MEESAARDGAGDRQQGEAEAAAAAIGAVDEPRIGVVVVERLERLRGLVRHLAASSGGGPSGPVDDLVQETVLRALQSIGRFEGRSEPWTWVAGIARKVVLKWRSETWTSTLGVDGERIADARSAAADQAQAPREEALAAERLLSLACLPERDRRLLWMRYCEDLSLQEIARREGSSHAAVRSALSRARRRARVLPSSSGR